MARHPHESALPLHRHLPLPLQLDLLHRPLLDRQVPAHDLAKRLLGRPRRRIRRALRRPVRVQRRLGRRRRPARGARARSHPHSQAHQQRRPARRCRRLRRAELRRALRRRQLRATRVDCRGHGVPERRHRDGRLRLLGGVLGNLWGPEPAARRPASRHEQHGRLAARHRRQHCHGPAARLDEGRLGPRLSLMRRLARARRSRVPGIRGEGPAARRLAAGHALLQAARGARRAGRQRGGGQRRVDGGRANSPGCSGCRGVQSANCPADSATCVAAVTGTRPPVCKAVFVLCLCTVEERIGSHRGAVQ
mmetsp:Transcript_48845/g.157865  ORF Transcript_48845/g.157865 Transcript_48845/m.157865 type:complete len:307 (+) Transcript_48845:695-1615(+)